MDLLQLEKSPHSNEDPAQQKVNKKGNKQTNTKGTSLSRKEKATTRSKKIINGKAHQINIH